MIKEYNLLWTETDSVNIHTHSTHYRHIIIIFISSQNEIGKINITPQSTSIDCVKTDEAIWIKPQILFKKTLPRSVDGGEFRIIVGGVTRVGCNGERPNRDLDRDPVSDTVSWRLSRADSLSKAGYCWPRISLAIKSWIIMIFSQRVAVGTDGRLCGVDHAGMKNASRTYL